MVYADAYGRAVLLADVNKGDQTLVQTLQLCGILLVGIFQVLEGAGGVDVVAGIDAHLLTVAGGHVSHVGVEMNVGHQRLHVAFSF